MKSRRTFIKKIYQGVGVALVSNSVLSISSCGNKGEAYTADEKKNMPQTQKKLGVALVGLGNYSEGQLGPALKETKFCKLAGIVTGTPSKVATWQKAYGIPDTGVYNYDNFESIRDNKDIDIVYVVLPNALHAEYVMKAATAGKHVICEKPMAVSLEECESMILACKQAGKMLSIGYRLHFEPFHKEMMRLGQEKIYGEIQSLKSANGFPIGGRSWRVDQKLSGGGPLMDVGIYCVQAAIYTIGKNPIAVTATEGKKTDMDTFRDVEQAISWKMEFPGNIIAECKTSYAESMDFLRADATKGWFELSPAYDYSRKQGSSSGGKMDFPDKFEQVYQLDDFAQCIIQNKPTSVPGEMGLRDMKVIKAIYESAKTGKRIALSL